MFSDGATSLGIEVFSASDLIKSGMLMSNASRNPNNPGEWDTTIQFRVDERSPEGRDLKALLEKAGVWFDT